MSEHQTESLNYQIPIDMLPLNVVVYRYDGSDFIIVDFNKQAQKTEGLKKEALLGKKLCDIFPSVKSFGLYDVLLRVHEKGEAESFDDTHYEDERISGWRKNKVIRLPNGDVMAIYEDLTKTKQLEAENHTYLQTLQESEEKFRTIAENTLMGVFIYQDYCVYVNDALVSLSEYSKEELYKMKIWDIVDTPFQENVKEIAEQRLQGKQFPYIYQDIKFITKSGKLKTARVSTTTIIYNGSIAGMGTVMDITDLKETQEQMGVLSQAIEQTDDLVKIIDANGKILFINDSVLSHSGYTREELVGAHSRIFKSGFHDSAFYSNLWKTVSSGKVYRNTFVNKKRDGSIFYEEETITPVSSENGKIQYYVATGKDISKRVQLENQLRESETNFRNIFNNSGDGIIIHDLEGAFLEVNSIVYNRLGYSKDEIIGKSLSLIDTPKSQKNISSTLKILQEKGHVMFEGEHRKKDGSVIPVEIHARTIEYMNKPAVLSVVRDIRKRKLAQQAIHDAQELYHTLFNLAPAGIVVIDPKNGKAVEFNRISHELLGYSAEEFSELSIEDYEVIETPEETAKHIEEIKKGNLEVFETKHQTKNGETRDVVVSAQRIFVKDQPYIFSVYHDITSLKQYERALKNISLRLSVATQSAEIGVWEWDIVNDILMWDEQMYKLYGINPEDGENTYMMWKNAIDPEYLDSIVGLVQKTIDGEEQFNTHYWIRTPSGEKRCLRATGTVEKDSEGKVISFIGVNWDITQQKEDERALNEAKSIAEAKNALLAQQAQTLEEYAFLDPLTHLANRRKFDNAFDVEWRRALRSNEPLSICMIDIDFFKAYNDSLGHDQGDICLQQVAAALSRSSLRAGELVARYGGEEFIVLLPNCDKNCAYQNAENIRKSVESLAIIHPDSKVASVVTISIGCATLYPSANIYEKKDLIKFADEALYKAKDNGRNRVNSSANKS